MCRHILNAKVAIQAPCCLKWYECTECHDDNSDHLYCEDKTISPITRFICLKCQRYQQRDISVMTENQKKCEGCGEVWCIQAITPELIVHQESLAFLRLSLMHRLASATFGSNNTSLIAENSHNFSQDISSMSLNPSTSKISHN